MLGNKTKPQNWNSVIEWRIDVIEFKESEQESDWNPDTINTVTHPLSYVEFHGTRLYVLWAGTELEVVPPSWPDIEVLGKSLVTLVTLVPVWHWPSWSCLPASLTATFLLTLPMSWARLSLSLSLSLSFTTLDRINLQSNPPFKIDCAYVWCYLDMFAFICITLLSIQIELLPRYIHIIDETFYLHIHTFIVAKNWVFKVYMLIRWKNLDIYWHLQTQVKTLTANFEVLQYQTCSQFKNTSKSTFSYFKIKIYLRQKNPLFLYLFEWEILFILLILLLLLCTNEQIRIC